ncbi:hypothetical protein CCGE525_35440 (plasmid) [Rhizobium jaguaris]|uniref:Uncharacterized protein n=1 Tax=Rhizobium jaguaris TaxID=1312183 RepID=A0A387G9P0_9HYPH|nr:hypothetical protein CCGE525_35440 [Rhizobium jaguaris]
MLETLSTEPPWQWVSRPEGFHLPASRRTVREPLDSHRSHQVNVFVPNAFQWTNHRRYRPSFDVQQGPIACDMLPDCFQQEIMRKIVKGNVARIPITRIYRRR